MGGTIWGKLDYIDRSNAKLTYSPYATYPLSMSLPLGSDLNTEKVASWFKNLLPEDRDMLSKVMEEANIYPEWFQLLYILGYDMPGDLIITPWGVQPNIQETSINLVDYELIVDKIKTIKNKTRRFVPFGRLSLGGAQSKFSLGLTADGTWYVPDILHPSTHIFKPVSKGVGFEDIEKLEVATMHLAGVCGISVAEASLFSYEGVTSYCVERFDRIKLPDGTIQRVWQEDLAQVMGVSRSTKYRSSPQELTNTLLDNGMPVDELYTWVSQVVYNVIVGNADAHSKNYSITRDSKWVPRFTPLYDSIALGNLPVRQTLAMPINGITYSEHVTPMDWHLWGQSIGLDGSKVQEIAKSIGNSIYHNVDDVFSSNELFSIHADRVKHNARYYK